MKKVLCIAADVIVYGILLVAIFIVASGCIEQFWPTPQVSPIVTSYAEKDPNNFKWPISTLGNMEKIRQEVAGVHLKKQINFRAEMEKDEGLYSLAIQEINPIIVKAREQYQSAVGTVASPGWLSLLILGGGGGLLGRKLTQLTHYSEQEHQADVAKAVAKANGTPTPPPAT